MRSPAAVFNSFPVYFQPLEQELEPVLRYVHGSVLNAGCGDRDISALLRANGARAVTNCDIVSRIPGAVLCNLAAVPFKDESFDVILNNAVMEHVAEPDHVMREFWRVLRQDGYLLLCIPFLQPYHPHPSDFRRYTREGMLQLATARGFDVVEIRPVHSIAQTLGWILWSYVFESRHAWLRYLFWAPIRLWTRACSATNHGQLSTANSFQMVLRKSAQT